MFLVSLDIKTNAIIWENGGTDFYSPPVLNEDASILYTFVNYSWIESFNASTGESLEKAFLPTPMKDGWPTLTIQGAQVLHLLFFVFIARST